MPRFCTPAAVAVLVSIMLAVISVPDQDRAPERGPVAEAEAHPGEPGPGHGCSNRTLKGPYGLYRSATGAAGPVEGQPGAIVGLVTFDGKGNCTVVATANGNGTVLRKSGTGTYTVHPDCSGSLTATAPPAAFLPFQAEGVIVNDGKDVLFIGTMAELVFSGVAKRI